MIFIFGIILAILLYGGFYFLGKILCKKNEFLKTNANRNNAIISSIILIPLVMTTDNEVLAYGIGYGLSPFLGTLIIHSIVINFFYKKNKKKEAFFNKDYYFGFLGIILLSYLALLLPAN